MAFINHEFNKRWQNIEKIFSHIKEMNIFPINIDGEKEITLDTLRQDLDAHKNTIFTIAVCGQVKVGKSTFLNSIFFEDNVLPSYATPKTAKLTFIKYGKEGTFDVDFYTQEEWDDLNNELVIKKLDSIKKKLDDEIEKCGKHFSVNKRDCIDKTKTGLSWNDLEAYVSVVDDGGKYTPFVKQVTLYVDNPVLKNIQIVDTPGLNDSDEINSYQTTNWIKKAHAVIYLFQVKGLEDSDLNFFDKYFPAEAKKSRIMVQNQIDCHADEYADGIRASQKSCQEIGLDVFGEDEVICSYSALASLAKAKEANGKDLTEEEEDVWDQCAEDFDPDPNNVAQKIEERLYKNNGEIIIDKVHGFLQQLIRLKKSFIASKIKHNENLITDCDKDSGKLQKEQTELEKIEQIMLEFNEDSKDEYRSKFQKINQNLKCQFKDLVDKESRKLERELEKNDTDKQLKNAVESILTDSINNIERDYPVIIENAKKQFYALIKENSNNAKKKLQNFECYDKIPVADYDDGEYSALWPEVNWEKITNAISWRCKNKTNQRIVFAKCNTILNEMVKKFDSEIADKIFKTAKKGLDKYATKVAEWAKKYSDDIENLKINRGKTVDEKKRLIQENNELQALLAELENLYSSTIKKFE